MNYKQSKEILEEIKKAKRILLVCHVGADPDCIISCLIMKKVIGSFGIDADVFSNEPFSKLDRRLDKNNEIKIASFEKFDYSPYDLFLVLDVNIITRLGIFSTLPLSLKLINIDHHESNEIDCLKISDTSYSSTSEMIFHLLEDWKWKFDSDDVDLLLKGILSDTDGFNYSASPRLFLTVSRLMERGASYDNAAAFLWRNNTLDQIRFLAKALSTVEVDQKHRFAYMALPYFEYEEFRELNHPARTLADKFARTIEDTDFGIAMIEHKVGELKVSVRSRERGFECISLVKELGGGGHKDGGGAMITGLPFKDAVEKVLQVARKFAKEK